MNKMRLSGNMQRNKDRQRLKYVQVNIDKNRGGIGDEMGSGMGDGIEVEQEMEQR